MATLSAARYDKLIANARARLVQPAYTENHHIKPRGEGGTDDSDNLVRLSAREHFLAHWLLYRIYRTPATARAFKLMANDQRLRRGRDYESARVVMSESMRGDKNVSKRPEVRVKLRANCYSAFAGEKRPEHATHMKALGLIAGDKNPFFGQGERQRGAANHMAKRIVGVHAIHGTRIWDTATAAGVTLGVSVQAVVQAIKLNGKSKGWRMEVAL
jgi:hypothetical protein